MNKGRGKRGERYEKRDSRHDNSGKFKSNSKFDRSSKYSKRKEFDNKDTSDNEKKEFYDRKKKSFSKEEDRKPKKFGKAQRFSIPKKSSSSDGERLNKFIAHAGVCSRRDADKLIVDGLITINGKVVNELGAKVMPGDEVRYAGEKLSDESMIYLLLNKPKDYITTMEDTHGRKTVHMLVKNACKERIYPVGRLDRATTGLLLFTNDGDFADKMAHPRNETRKVYEVKLNKNFKPADIELLLKGIELEDGTSTVDKIEYIDSENDKSWISIQIHSGKNRIIRRMMEHLGYKVAKLDRIAFGPFTKKGIPRGRWKLLNEKEIGFLKMGLNKSKK